MERIVCLRHPKYDGKNNPELRCKACCSIFVNRIKAINGQRAVDVEVWLATKIKAHEATVRI